MFKKILVPLDGSELAERALEPAMVLAQQGQGEVYLLSVPILQHMVVMDPVPYGFLLPEQSVEQSRHDLLMYLHGLVEKLAYPGVVIHSLIEEGDEATVIVETAAAEGVDLIVMSTHGRTGFTRWMLGSITEKVLREAHCPVLVLRKNEPLSRMVIALDRSELAAQAVAPGMAVAQSLGCHVTLFSVVQPLDIDPHLIASLDKLEHGFGDRLREDNYTHTTEYLSQVAIRCKERVPELTTEVWGGEPAQTIVDFVDARHINLIVMATHGRTGFQRWVHGSVMEKVLRTAPCALLVVRPQVEEA